MADTEGKGKEKEEIKKDEEGIPINKKDLPYEGDRVQAMRNNDRSALRLITQWIQKYGKVTVVRKEIKQLPVEAKNCKNEEDYVSLERWSEDELPNIFIKYMTFDGEVEGTYCYKREDIIKMMDNPLNQLAAWVRPRADASFDDDGYVIIPGKTMNESNKYAEASIKELFTEIPLRRIFFRNSLVKLINYPGKNYVAFPTYSTRVGNLSANYGSSRVHGQAPDNPIYFLLSELSDYENVFDRIYPTIYNIKTNKFIAPSYDGHFTSQDIINLQNQYSTAQADINYYWNGMEEQQSMIYYPELPLSPLLSSNLPADDDLYSYTPEILSSPEYDAYDEGYADHYEYSFVEQFGDYYSPGGEFDFNERTQEILNELDLNSPVGWSNDNLIWGYAYFYINNVSIVLSSDNKFVELRKTKDTDEIAGNSDYYVISRLDKFEEFLKGVLDLGFESTFSDGPGRAFVDILTRAFKKVDSNPGSENYKNGDMMIVINQIFANSYSIWVDKNNFSRVLIRKQLAEGQELSGARENYKVIQNWKDFDEYRNLEFDFYAQTYSSNVRVRELIEAAFAYPEIASESDQLVTELGLDQFSSSCEGQNLFPDYHDFPENQGYFNLYLSDINVWIYEYYDLDFPKDKGYIGISRKSDVHPVRDRTIVLTSLDEVVKFIRDPQRNLNLLFQDVLCKSVNQVATLDHNSEKYQKIKMLVQLDSIFHGLQFGLLLGDQDDDNKLFNFIQPEEGYTVISDWKSLETYGVDNFYNRYKNSEQFKNLVHTSASEDQYYDDEISEDDYYEGQENVIDDMYGGEFFDEEIDEY